MPRVFFWLLRALIILNTALTLMKDYYDNIKWFFDLIRNLF